MEIKISDIILFIMFLVISLIGIHTLFLLEDITNNVEIMTNSMQQFYIDEENSHNILSNDSIAIPAP